MLTLKDFDYDLPSELIASYPASRRSDARLLIVNRKTGGFEHRIFREIDEYLQPGDLLVLNNTKVLPARFYGKKPTGGKVEALLLKKNGENVWEMLIKPSGRIKKGTKIIFGENGFRLEGEVLDEPNGETGIRRIRFVHVGTGLVPAHEGQPQGLPLQSVLHQIGRIPLPPYIDRLDEPLDRELYQTVFAEVEGAVASPTAGLHFDSELLSRLAQKGIEICLVTLHVGYGTFQPVRIEDLAGHKMYEEEFEISEKAADQIQNAINEKRRIIACGTTIVRVLETICRGGVTPPLQAKDNGARPPSIQPIKEKTNLFIYPPYNFKVVDAMITNFHLPRTTLLMLASAFGGHDLVVRAYGEAIKNKYRFYSYGDAMLIL